MADVVVIGAGPMGRLHARTVHRHPRFRLAGVVDHHPERAERVVRELGGSATMVDADLYIVATPASTHVEVALPLLDRGRVLIEKPVCTEWHEALEHPWALAAWSERYLPCWSDLEVREQLRIRRARRSRARDIDVIADLMIHDLDLVCWKAGEVELEDAAWTATGARATLRFEGGSAHVEVGESGDSWVHADGVALDLALGSPDPLTRQLDALALHLDGEDAFPTASQARRVLDLVEAVRNRCDSRS